MPRLTALALLLLLVGCRTTDPYVAPDVPPEATEIVLTDDERPRVLYASAWGAFARFGWEMVDADPAVLRFVAQPPDGRGSVEVVVDEQVEGGRLGNGRLVARADGPDRPALLEAAAGVLATVPGRLSVR